MSLDDKPFWKGVFSVLKPLPLLSLSEWSDRFRILSGAGSSEKGMWRNDRTPYLMEIMKELSPQSRTREVVFMKGIQIGATEMGLNWALYTMHLRPGPFLFLMPTDGLVSGFSKQRFSPSLEQCDFLLSKIVKKHGKSLTEIVYQGGYISLKGASSPNALSSNPFRDIVCDEIDRYLISVGDEGDPIGLIKKRMSTFPNGKIFCISTPTMQETSKISELYQDSDQRVYMVPCPHCSGHSGVPDNGFFEIKFEQLRWTRGVYSDVKLYCPICGEGIPEYHKTDMLAKGKWVAQNPGHQRAGFHLSTLYSPIGWYSWEKATREFDEAGQNAQKIQVFINTILGLPYEEDGEKVAEEYLLRRAVMYNAEVPNEVMLLTMAVDVHTNFLEIEVAGWARGERRWGILHKRMEGPTYNIQGVEHGIPAIWRELDEFRLRRFKREDGKLMSISCVMIDSGGAEATTDTVYAYCRARERQMVFCLKGSNQFKDPIYTRPKSRNPQGLRVFRVGTFEAKRLIYNRLKIENPNEEGYYTFPLNEEAGYDAIAYASLIVERLRSKYVNGQTKLYWWRPPGARNELLDLNVYNLVAIRHMNPDWKMLENRYSANGNNHVPVQKPAPIKKSGLDIYTVGGKSSGISMNSNF